MSKSSEEQKIIASIKSRLPHCSKDKLKYLDDASKKNDVALLIPEKAVSTPTEDIEDKNFTLSFDYLNEDLCDFDSINDSKARAMVKKIKQINMTPLNKKADLGIRATIRRNSQNKEYDLLFKNLTDDVGGIDEIPFAGEGRIFSFFDAVATFYIVAIKAKHINLHHE